MSEIRKQLTELQFRLMVSTQLDHERATAQLEAAVKRQDEVRALVFDAHGIPPVSFEKVIVTTDTRELILTIPTPLTQVPTN